jgi:hypothetical protein
MGAREKGYMYTYISGAGERAGDYYYGHPYIVRRAIVGKGFVFLL